MNKAMTLSEIFAQKQTSEIDMDGLVYSLYELPTDASEVTVRFVSGKSQPSQGLRLKVRGGAMTVDSTVGDDIVLWHDTAPDEVQIKFAWNSKGQRSLRVWNAWRVKGVTQAWLGNAGMRVTALESGVFEFSCSDGEGAPNFGDLVARVELH